MRAISFKISDELLQELDKFAYKHHMDRSEVIRRAIIEYIRRNNNQ